MSEYVVRMRMPQSCYNCDLRYECNAFYAPGKPKPFMKGCRIVCQLPEGHGDLIDRDSMVEEWVDEKIGNPHADYEADDVIYDLKKRTVIVPKDKAHEP